MKRRFIILTQGKSNPHSAKTACSVIRYRTDEVLAVLDDEQLGKTTASVLGVGGEIPFVGQLSDAPSADTLLIGIAPTGGKIPESWRPIILEAIHRKMDVVSGLHEFLADDEEFAAAAKQAHIQLTDVRRNQEKTIARRLGLDPNCFRLHTVGHDCSVGKMVTAIEVERGLRQRGWNSKFIATGQTGILIEGDGCPADCVVADFVSGALEQQVLQQQHHECLVVEGQGSLVHPSYSAVTLGILHGCLPHALLLCYEVGREGVHGVEHVPLPPLSTVRHLCETMASIHQPCPVLGVSMNSRRVSPSEADVERDRLQEELNLPVCDIFRHGPEPLLEAVIRYRDAGSWRNSDDSNSPAPSSP